MPSRPSSLFQKFFIFLSSILILVGRLPWFRTPGVPLGVVCWRFERASKRARTILLKCDTSLKVKPVDLQNGNDDERRREERPIGIIVFRFVGSESMRSPPDHQHHAPMHAIAYRLLVSPSQPHGGGKLDVSPRSLLEHARQIEQIKSRPAPAERPI